MCPLSIRFLHECPKRGPSWGGFLVLAVGRGLGLHVICDPDVLEGRLFRDRAGRVLVATGRLPPAQPGGPCWPPGGDDVPII